MKNIKRGYLISLSFVINIIAITILMLKIFYPYYRVIAITIYLIGWIPFILSLKTEDKTKIKFLKRNKKTIAIFIISIITLSIILVIFPIDDITLLKEDKEILKEKLIIEQKYAENYIIQIEKAEKKFLNEIEGISLNNLEKDKKQKIKEKWGIYFDYFIKINTLTENNKYFYQISYIKYRELNEQSFMIAYSSFMTSQISVMNIINTTKEIEFIESLLNEENIEYGIPENTYFEINKRMADPSNIIQANAGYAYLQTINQDSLNNLKQISKDKYNQFIRYANKAPELKIKTLVTYFEKNSFKTWFPIQKTASEMIGDTKIPARQIPLISLSQIEKIKENLQPGDVLIQRRNWWLSNAGLPGFWKHTAIYVSNLSKLNEYFTEETKKTNITQGLTLSEYLKTNHPELYKELVDNKLRTIEAESEGIISFTLEKSASADYLAILRPNISKEEKLEALIYTFNQFGKPYDFNFDFITDKEIVCSELYYKAYPQLNHTLRITSGRLVLSTNHIAEDFNKNKGLLEVIYFIDGNEKERNANFKTEKEFENTWQRSSADIWKTN
jgi:hypothetical protein